ncbi:hypothetical protein L2E82_17862 [Cichorium intybus]|uniref:Uncharacterized protein n=1 Tax=Cichorium intybus TaxID=13427 RepID=A0ACB9F9N4_CICIN|nr:hypothetical protein L2E82_17862 [Cichorium intybus]
MRFFDPHGRWKHGIGIIAWNCAQIATDQETAQAPGAVRPGPGRGAPRRSAPSPWRANIQIHLKRQDQISRESLIDKNGTVSQSILTRPDKPYMVRPYGYDIGLFNPADAISSSPASKEITPGVTAANVKNRNSDLNAYIKGPSPRVRVFGKFLEWSRLVSAEALWFQGFEGLKEEIQRGERLIVDRVHSFVLQKQGYVSDAGSAKPRNYAEIAATRRVFQMTKGRARRDGDASHTRDLF